MATKPKVDPRMIAALMAQRQAAQRPMPPQGRPMPPQGAVPPGMKKGGSVDGVAKKGKTKGRMC